MDPTFELVIVRPQLRAKPAGLFFRRQRLKLDPRQKKHKNKRVEVWKNTGNRQKNQRMEKFCFCFVCFSCGSGFHLRKQLKGHIYSSMLTQHDWNDIIHDYVFWLDDITLFSSYFTKCASLPQLVHISFLCNICLFHNPHSFCKPINGDYKNAWSNSNNS